MANPNIVATTTIYAKTSGLSVPTTIASGAIVTNPNSSGKVYKINVLMIANIDGSIAYPITADIYKSGTTSYKIAGGIIVPATTTIVLVTRDSGIYLEETDVLRVSTTTASKLDAICSYEIIG
jgi:hypothetical protein